MDMTVPSKTAKQLKYDTKRLEVIRASARIFAKLGYHRASITDVARELGITAAALYYYVKSKDELLFEAGKIALDELETAFNGFESDPSLSSLEKLRRYLRYHAEYVCEDFGRCLVLTSANDLPSPYRESMNDQGSQVANAVRKLIRTGVADGSIRPCNDMLIANALFGAVNTMARWWSPKERLSPAQAFDGMFDTLTAGLNP